MAFTIDFNLQVEDPAGSNNWIHYPGGITRLTGETAYYRIYYSFSSTESGAFEEMSFEVTFPDTYDNLKNVSYVGLPVGASYTMTRSATELKMKILFAASLPPGQSGFMEFLVSSNTPAGPNEYLISPTIALTGSFYNGNGTETPIDEINFGPTWTVSCVTCDELKKIVTYNGQIYVEDDEAYIVDYRVTRTYSPPVPGSNNGIWAITSCTLSEFLPTIPGVTPEIVWSSRAYTVAGNTVVWDFAAPFPYSSGVQTGFRLHYPKDQVDALGGPAALGNITNNTTADYVLRGDVPAALNASVTHRLLPTPMPILGTTAVSKVSTPVSIPGTMLGVQDIGCQFSLRLDGHGSNMIPRSVTLTDTKLTVELEDGTTYWPAPDEIVWNSVMVYNDTVTLEYQTALGGDVWTPDPTIVGRVNHPFPMVSEGDYITVFRVTGSTFVQPSSPMLATVNLTIKRRNPTLQHYKTITNEVTASVTMSNGAILVGDDQVIVPVEYSQVIVTEISRTAVENLTVNPGGTADLSAELVIAPGTTEPVTGTDLLVVIPQAFGLVEVIYDITPLDPSEYTVTPDWEAPGQTLLRVPVKYGEMSQAGNRFRYKLKLQVDPLIVPGVHNFDFWYVINTLQANDPGITHSAAGTTAQDVYDFDQDGDITELVAMQTLPVTVSAAHVVNVIKLSKSARDPDFIPDSDTYITAGEMYQYRLSVRNDSADPMTDLVMIDIFPYSGDVYGSQWRPLLRAPIVPPAGVDVKYSLSNDPIMAPVGPGGVGVWLDDPPEDITTVHSIRLDFGGRVFQSGESASLILDMIGPLGVPLETTCYNSVRYVASAIISGSHVPYLPAYSPTAYAKVTMTEGRNTIGDFVWSDINGNGVQDPGEPGLNGITVELYNDQEFLQYTTVSGNHPVDGSPGYYIFEGLMDDGYRVKFDPAPLTGGLLTIQHAGSDPALDSDPDPVSGQTEIINVAGGEIRTDIDAGYLKQDTCRDGLYQAMVDLMESVALEQAALSHIINAEGERLQAIFARTDQTPESLVKANDSARRMVDSIAQLEIVLQAKFC